MLGVGARAGRMGMDYTSQVAAVQVLHIAGQLTQHGSTGDEDVELA